MADKPPSKWSRVYWNDTGERVARTFLATALPLWVTAGNVAQNLDFLNVLELSGSAAGVSLILCLLGNLQNGESGPSLLPSPPAPQVNPPDAV